MLIKVKNQETVSLPALVRLALKYVYERKSMSAAEERTMMEGIVAWNKHVLITEREKELLMRIAWFLDKAKNGGFERRKELFKKHKIDYRKFHRQPEVMPRRGYAF